MKNPLIIGNWKLNGNKKFVKNLIVNIKDKLNPINGCDIAIAPPLIYLNIAKFYLKNSKINLVAQNVDINLYGAYTGEISAEMLRDIGVKYVIIGHSERRIFHNETDQYISKKFFLSKKAGLTPILCIGENEHEKINGKTKEVCIRQINSIINNFDINAFNNTIIAYEPIWAIGTGKSAQPEEVQIIHKFIRNYIKTYNEKISKNIILQYGGSVNFYNAYNFLIQPDIDSLLVGGASLKASSFIKIVKAALKAKKNNIIYN